MSEEELISQFRAAVLPHAEWTHQAHLRVAIHYLRRFTPEETLARLRHEIQRLNLFHGVFTTPRRGYHETRTRVWLAVLYHALCEREEVSTEELVGKFAKRDVAVVHYLPETLSTWEARIDWVTPDRSPLPLDPGPWCERTPELFTLEKRI